MIKNIGKLEPNLRILQPNCLKASMGISSKLTDHIPKFDWYSSFCCTIHSSKMGIAISCLIPQIHGLKLINQRASKRASFWFSKCQPLAATWQPLAQAATWQPLGSHLLRQPLGSHLAAICCNHLGQVSASGCKWLPSGCQVAAWASGCNWLQPSATTRSHLPSRAILKKKVIL